MSIRNFVPEIWAGNVEAALRKRLVYGGPAVVNRDYEGEISQAGDTVHVTTVGRPNVYDYVPDSTVVTPEQINTAQRTFRVDQAKYWAIAVDDVDKRQARNDFMPEATDESGYAIAEGIDRYIAGLHTQIPTANNVGTVTADLTSPSSWDTEARKVYDDLLVPLGVRLDEQDVPDEGRYATIPPWLYGLLRRDPRFIEADKSANPGALRTGVVGDAAGFTILRSRNVPEVTSNNFVVTAGTSKAITFASQITEVEAYRSQTRFADAIRGLYLYGATVFRPEFIVKGVAVKS